MEYMILLYSDEAQHPDFEPGSPEFEAMMAEWMSFNQSLADDGHFISGANLADTGAATMIHKTMDGATTTDGPYADSKEQIGGYYVVSAEDLDQAIDIAKRIPIPVGSFEVRPIEFRPGAE